MAILFCGIVMSHYTHFNLSPVTQITMQQTMRTLAFIAGEVLDRTYDDCCIILMNYNFISIFRDLCFRVPWISHF